MTERAALRAYDYVNRPYAEVREALLAEPEAIFASATRAATRRAESVATGLRIDIGGIEIGTDVLLSIGDIDEQPASGGRAGKTTMAIEWQAAHRPRLFPLMKAELAVYPLTSSETQLDFRGEYEPPLGLIGDAFDAVLGHRLAEASVHRLVREVASYLRSRPD